MHLHVHFYKFNRNIERLTFHHHSTPTTKYYQKLALHGNIRKTAGDPGSNPGLGENFFSLIINIRPTRWLF